VTTRVDPWAKDDFFVRTTADRCGLTGSLDSLEIDRERRALLRLLRSDTCPGVARRDHPSMIVEVESVATRVGVS